MKRFVFLLACCGVLACAAELAGGRTVYILSMSRGLDQYLANRLTNGHVLQVVTDPKLADFIFTDHLGDAFQAQLEEISPSPVKEDDAPATNAKPNAKGDAKAPAKPEAKPEAKAEATEPSGNLMFSPPVNKLASPSLASTFGRNKGTVFLVDAKSRQVVWSVFDPPKSFGNKEMDRTASAIVSRLKKDLHKK